ncbi:MAG: response regulator [Sphingobacteriales bacterium]|nr:MAG: response regulator [Sphingobacteriales bacterium]
MKKVMVVEDSIGNADALTLLMNNEGYATKTLYNGKGIIREVLDFMPQVIILDVFLSDADGRELANAIKSVLESLGIKIILTSAALSIGLGHTIPQEICDAFILKPFNAEEMVSTVRQLLR